MVTAVGFDLPVSPGVNFNSIGKKNNGSGDKVSV